MKSELTLPQEVVINKIYRIRGQNIMLDRDLSALYQVETKNLKRQVRRNLERFPEDFMFELTKDEFDNLRCQVGTSSYGGTRYLPMAFTEQGVSMLSSVLKSTIAIQVNIQIIRVFTKMREALSIHKDLALEIDEIRNTVTGQDEKIETIFNYLKRFIQKQDTPREKVGYK